MTVLFIAIIPVLILLAAINTTKDVYLFTVIFAAAFAMLGQLQYLILDLLFLFFGLAICEYKRNKKTTKLTEEQVRYIEEQKRIKKLKDETLAKIRTNAILTSITVTPILTILLTIPFNFRLSFLTISPCIIIFFIIYDIFVNSEVKRYPIFKGKQDFNTSPNYALYIFLMCNIIIIAVSSNPSSNTPTVNATQQQSLTNTSSTDPKNTEVRGQEKNKLHKHTHKDLRYCLNLKTDKEIANCAGN